MAAPPKQLTDEQMARALAAARKLAGEHDGAPSAAENKVIKALRASIGRPSKKEIAALAKKLARPD
jgi:hypothetical protein